MSAKEIVQNFYKSDVILEVEKFSGFLHPEIILQWYSTKGFLELNYDQLVALSDEISKTYVRSKCRISHITEEENTVAVRYSQYVKTIENPREEMLLAHFMVIWEIKDNKLYRGYQMSQT